MESSKFCHNCGESLAPGSPRPTDSSTGLKENIAGLLCYVLGWITGLIFFLYKPAQGFSFQQPSSRRRQGLSQASVDIALLPDLPSWLLPPPGRDTQAF